ncbi:MAG: hemerythrin family protein [Thermodesulfobacteriota bacterium]
MSLKWKDSFSIGVDSIDKQHKELFEEANVFITNMSSAKDIKKIRRMFIFLENYVLRHFRLEEKHMRQAGYPKYESHKAMHEEFKYSLAGLKAALNEWGPSEALLGKTTRFVKTWLLAHVGKADKSFGDFLKKESPAAKAVPASRPQARKRQSQPQKA